MITYRFYQLDVFTDQAFSGNPLAVFPDGTGLSDEQMQAIAREMNLSETVFVLESNQSEALRRLRIFTPTRELPMAGHPVVGTWNLLAREGVVPLPADGSGTVTIQQELGLGVLPVEIEFADNLPTKVTMTQGAFMTGATVTDHLQRIAVAEALGVSTNDFYPDAPLQVAATGINILIVPLNSLDALKCCNPDFAQLTKATKSFSPEVYAFTLETIDGGDSAAHARLFAPELGVSEDPATGSAAGALGGYLVHHNLLETTPENNIHSLTVEQGDFINRKSRINVEVTGEPNNVQQVRVGGASVVVAKGELYVD